jgi:hypothetical protein
VWDFRDVPIHDARAIPGGATLKKNGFTTLPHHPAIDSWEGDDWRGPYMEEIADLVKSATGATEVLPTRNSGRSESPFGLRSSKYDPHGFPIAFIHNDFTSGSGPRHLAKDYPERAQSSYGKRFAIYNVWHLLSPPPQSYPLAICDPNSLRVSDLVPGEARFGQKDSQGVWGENSMFRYNPAHRWYYYPDLRNDETLIFCGYDSDSSNPSIVPHASFRDPSCQKPGAERTCVHGTVYAFFN